MNKVTNTTKKVHDDPASALLEAAVVGTTGFIEGMEARGQREMVASAVLPVEGSDNPKLVELGFTFGDPVSGDPIFRKAALPAGWKRAGSDHSMWSYIVDERGIKRVSIFYKAAFYDRSAHMALVNVGAGEANEAIYNEAAEIPWTLLTSAEREDAIAALQQYLGQADKHPDIYAARAARVKALLVTAGPPE